ncbi:polyprenyl synthetase family protein [Bacteriovorax sp. DB6_IX]|uniref:polyprenyl synthetase family protein n=1 Tax=Bacteriovorax sp. DB6_IX TaxID=1353530 RepID=UPI00038A3F63|nr:polyprenyl synthetase family protein [Bacteriovorax sp. DB6_IX]EQC49797.1 heptaprenyl pyrophosphate synthase component 2 domain protein [Bacteriovorax sp. DB6_IX]
MTNFLEAIPGEILEKIGDMDLSIESESCHEAVSSVLAKTVLSGGKRLRPMLCFLMGRYFNIEINKLDPFAKSIEMVHAASLAHDDVVDNATQRRGEPSINIVSSNKRAVLAGDYLLADVIYTLSNQGDLKIVQEMSKVIQDLALGEWIQSDAIEQRAYTQELIERIAHYKTASVMSWCTWIGAYAAGAPESICEQAREFGHRVGLAFQMMDDTLDFASTSDKDFLLDVKNGVVNSVILEWLILHPSKYEAYKSGTSLESLWNEDRIEEAVAIVEARAREHMNIAGNCLNSISEYLISQGMDKEEANKRMAPLEFIMSFIIDRNH